MKFFETHFVEYVKKVEEYSLHPIMKKVFSTFPQDIQSLPSMIIYGPSGVGKYSHALYMISRYSPSQLKYEKRIAVPYNKETFFLKISDCHFEVDMSLLGCNSKHLWNEILVTDFNNIFYKNSFKYYEQINYFFLFPITNFSYCTK